MEGYRMSTRRKICLCGNSVILGALDISLRKQPQFEVVTINKPQVELDLKNLSPDIIFFDLGSQNPHEAFSLLGENPGLKIIGVSPDTNVVKVWSGKQLKNLLTEDLMEVINENPNLQV